MLMMALLPPGGLLGGYAGDPDGVNGSWEKACTYVSTPIRVRVAEGRELVLAQGLTPLVESCRMRVHVSGCAVCATLTVSFLGLD